MFLICSLVPATFFLIVGYFVLFSSKKVDGFVGKFGRLLATWVFVIAAFFPVMGAYATLSGQCPMEEMLKHMNSPVVHQTKPN